MIIYCPHIEYRGYTIHQIKFKLKLGIPDCDMFKRYYYQGTKLIDSYKFLRVREIVNSQIACSWVDIVILLFFYFYCVARLCEEAASLKNRSRSWHWKERDSPLTSFQKIMGSLVLLTSLLVCANAQIIFPDDFEKIKEAYQSRSFPNGSSNSDHGIEVSPSPRLAPDFYQTNISPSDYSTPSSIQEKEAQYWSHHVSGII